MTGGKEPGPPGQQQAGNPTPNGQGNPGGNAAGPAPGGAPAGGARGKDVKAPPPAHQPPFQVLQLTPELFQQTVAAAVTAALTAAQGPPAAQAAAAAAIVPGAAATPVVPRKEKKLAEFWTSRPTMWFRLFDGQFPETQSCLLYTSDAADE